MCCQEPRRKTRSGLWASSTAPASASLVAWPHTARTTRPTPAMTTSRRRTRQRPRRWAISWARRHLQSWRSECQNCTYPLRAVAFHLRFPKAKIHNSESKKAETWPSATCKKWHLIYIYIHTYILMFNFTKIATPMCGYSFWDMSPSLENAQNPRNLVLSRHWKCPDCCCSIGPSISNVSDMNDIAFKKAVMPSLRSMYSWDFMTHSIFSRNLT